MSDSTNWSFRFDGPEAGANLSYAAIESGDLDNDGLNDFIVSARNSDLNGRTDSGSTYIILASRINTFPSKIIDLSDEDNFDLRFDSPANNSGGRSISTNDINGDDKADLTFVNYVADNNGTNSGSVYIFFNDFLNDHFGVDKTLDLADTDNFTVRIDGTGANDIINNIEWADVTNDGDPELFLHAPNTTKGWFVIDNSVIIAAANGTNIFNMSDTSKYIVRYRGVASDAMSIPPDKIVIYDYDNDDKLDIVLAAVGEDFNGRTNSGSVYMINNTQFNTHTGTGNNIVLSNSSEYEHRFDGPVAISVLGYSRPYEMADIDNDGLGDLFIGARTSFNSRSLSGSIYVIYGSTIEDLSGKTHDLSSSSNYDLRFDGEEADDWGFGAEIRTADLDHNGIDDVIFGMSGNNADESNPKEGKVYVFFDHLFEDFSAGNYDLADSAIYSFRYLGGIAGDWLSGFSLLPRDLNSDGLTDLIMGIWGADNKGTLSGSVYLVYYFPHTINIDKFFSDTSGKAFTMTGNVSAPDNPTHIARVQWGHHRSFGDLDATVNTDFMNAWIDCSPTDGAFDSNDEDFFCNHSPLDGRPHFGSPHTVFVRAQDEKGIWTPISQYIEKTFTNENPFKNIDADATRGLVEISWEMNDPHDTTIQYWKKTKPQNIKEKVAESSDDGDFKVKITGLSACTEYEYVLRSTDVAGNTAASNTKDFKTLCVANTTSAPVPSLRASLGENFNSATASTSQSTSSTVITNIENSIEEIVKDTKKTLTTTKNLIAVAVTGIPILAVLLIFLKRWFRWLTK